MNHLTTAVGHWPVCPVCGAALEFGGAEGLELRCPNHCAGLSDLGPCDPVDDDFPLDFEPESYESWAEYDSFVAGEQPLGDCTPSAHWRDPYYDRFEPSEN